jgi:hypothetical protein
MIHVKVNILQNKILFAEIYIVKLPLLSLKKVE